MNLEDYNEYYIQGSDHYLIPRDVFKELFNEMVNWKEEAKELKKQLENYKKLGFKYLQDKNNKLETQQKEFIKYLENMLDDENDIFSVVRVKDVLSKFKEIIGVSDENNMGK